MVDRSIETKNLLDRKGYSKSRRTVIRNSSVRTYFVRRRWCSPHPATGTATPLCAQAAYSLSYDCSPLGFPVFYYFSIDIYLPYSFIYIQQRFFCLVIAQDTFSHLYIYIYIYKFNSGIIISKIVIPVANRCYYWRNHHHHRRLLLPSLPLQLPLLILHNTFVTTTSTTDQRQPQRQRYIDPPKKYDSSATTIMSRARYVLLRFWNVLVHISTNQI